AHWRRALARACSPLRRPCARPGRAAPRCERPRPVLALDRRSRHRPLRGGLPRPRRALPDPRRRLTPSGAAKGTPVSNILTRAPRMPGRCIRSHESIAQDPVVLVLDPLSLDSTLIEHRERLLAGGEVLENLVD